MFKLSWQRIVLKVRFSSSPTADQDHPCVWVGQDEPLPIIKQKGYGENNAAEANSCINRFEEIDSPFMRKSKLPTVSLRS